MLSYSHHFDFDQASQGTINKKGKKEKDIDEVNRPVKTDDQRSRYQFATPKGNVNQEPPLGFNPAFGRVTHTIQLHLS